MLSFRYQRLAMAGLTALVLMGFASMSAKAVDLSDNLSKTTTDTEAAAGDTWLTASFKTDASAYTLKSVTLLLANPISGTAELDIFADGGLEPGSFVGSLTAPTNYSASLANATFSTVGITLSSNATYWVVLKALSGEFDWAWTSDNTGDGAGFLHIWGSSSDAGVTWFTYDIYPTQFSVTAIVPIAGDVNGDGCVDDFDLTDVILDFGGAPSGSHGNTDINGDGVVNDFDLTTVIVNFLKGC